MAPTVSSPLPCSEGRLWEAQNLRQERAAIVCKSLGKRGGIEELFLYILTATSECILTTYHTPGRNIHNRRPRPHNDLGLRQQVPPVAQEPHLKILNGPLVDFPDATSYVFKRTRDFGHRCSTDIKYIVRYLDLISVQSDTEKTALYLKRLRFTGAVLPQRKEQTS